LAGYSQTPLLKKLGIKAGASYYIYDAPFTYFTDLGDLPDGVVKKLKLVGRLDFVHLFVKESKLFQDLFISAKQCLAEDGMIWISWPKKSSKVQTDLNENIIRDFGLSAGLVDVKVCAVDEIWSGLKFVIRLKDRK
jgi:hypothetical protein